MIVHSNVTGSYVTKRDVVLGAMGGRGAAIDPNYLIRDDFVGADNTALTAHTMDKGAGWTAVIGTYKLSGNTVIPNAIVTFTAIAVTEASVTHAKILCRMTPYHSGTNILAPGIVCRYVDASNYLLVQIDSAAGKLTFYKNVAGVFTLLTSQDYAFVSGAAYNVSVEIIGDQYFINCTGLTEIVYQTSVFNTGTKYGIRTGKTQNPVGTCVFDNFLVYPESIVIPEFTRYAGNPVLTLGAAGSWEDVDVAAPDVKWDVPNNRYLMHYSGYDGALWHSGFATSTDLISWTKFPENPVLTPNAHEGYLAGNGSVVYIGGTYYLYYQCESNELHCATSTDLVNWTRANSGSAILTGTVGQWDAGGIFDFQAALSDDGTKVVLYHGGFDAGHINRKIGKATAPVATPTVFTKIGVVLNEKYPYNFGAPSPQVVAGSPVFFNDAAINSGARFVGYQYLRKGAYQDYIILEKIGSGWEKTQVSDVTSVWKDGTLYLIYCGAPNVGGGEGMGDQIGVATWTP